MARPSLDKNVKYKSLIKRMRLPRPYVRGLLETLWDVANECGNPVLGDSEQVEAAAEWPGESGKLFAALKALVFIDQLQSGEWEIHDYWDHAPEYVKGRMRKEKERKRKNNVTRQSRDGHGTVAEKSDTPAPAHLIKEGVPSLSADADAVSTGEGSSKQSREAQDPTEASSEEGEATQAAKPDESTPAENPATAKRARKAQGSSRPEHDEVKTHFRERWKVRYGIDHAWKHARDGAHVKWILDTLGRNPERAKAVIDVFLADDDPWVVGKAHELGLLVSGFNRYRVGQPARNDDPLGNIGSPNFTPHVSPEAEAALEQDWKENGP